jgi:hypothetical protein
MASSTDSVIILVDKIVLINSLARLHVRQPFFRHQNKIAPGWVNGHRCVLQHFASLPRQMAHSARRISSVIATIHFRTIMGKIPNEIIESA